jgi:hypothetical protein
VALGEHAIGIGPVDQRVAARRRRGDVDVLALEVGGVLVAVSDGYPGEETAQAGFSEAARVPLTREWPESGKIPGPPRPVAVAEAEPRLAVASHHAAGAANAA